MAERQSVQAGDVFALPTHDGRIGFPLAWEVVDYSGTRRRPATDLEDLLPYRTVVSPISFEVALLAHLGLEDWSEAFDALRPQGGVRSADLFG